MAITTQTMIENRIGSAELVRLTDDGQTGSVNEDVLNRMIDEGEGELLNNIGQRYALPLGLTDAHTASAVRGMMLDAVVYRLLMHRDHVVGDEQMAAYKHAVEWSEKIAAGKLGLVGETLLGESPAQAGQIVITSGDQVITRDSMQGL